METADYFRKAVQNYLDGKPRGAQSNLAKDTGINRIHLNDFLGGRRALQERDRMKTTEFLNCDYLAFLQHGKNLIEGKPTTPDPIDPIVIKATTTKDKELTEELIPNYRAVPLYESGRLAAWSNGAAFDRYEDATSQVIVYLPELAHHANHRLIAARVGGDSMEPLIPEGSIVIIDRDDREFAKNQIFAVVTREGGEDVIAVKRVKMFEEAEGFALISENPEYSLRFVKEGNWLNLCVGRVIWMWRSFGR